MAAPEPPERLKGRLRKDWSDPATIAAWRKWDRQLRIATRQATEAIVEAARVEPGMRVLDLASGSGEPAVALARAVVPEGHVTATDLVPEMLALASEYAGEQALRNIAFQPADPEELPFPDESFDVVTARYGITFFADVPRALREIRRVLEPGGRAVFLVDGHVEENPLFAATFGVVMKYLETAPAPADAPGLFRFAARGKLAAALRAAAFREVEEERRSIEWRFPGRAEEVCQYMRERSTPLRKLAEHLPPEQTDEVVHEILAALRPFDNGREVICPATVVLAWGIR
jgi:SAM-dependent methyltransferase